MGIGRDTNRLEAFGDAVIAIAIALLALEIHVPERDDARSTTAIRGALRRLGPEYLGYLISFLTIGIMWANYHELFEHIARTDHYLIPINVLFLLCIGFLPFPTAFLSRFLGHPGELAAIVVSNGFFLATALSSFLLWWYPFRNARLLEPGANPSTVRTITSRFRLGPPSYRLAFVSTTASLPVLLGVALLSLLPSAAVEG